MAEDSFSRSVSEPWGAEGLPLEQARDLILEALSPLERWQELPLVDCLGRICAEPVVAPAAVPGFRAAILDGYAVSGEQPPQPGSRWRLVGRSAAGAPYAGLLGEGEAVRVLTGAVLPEGGGRVLAQELVALVGEGAETLIELRSPCGPNPWIRSPEEEAYPGQELVPAGGCLGAATLGRLAGCGVQRLRVRARPRIGLLVSGDELRPAGVERGPGQIWESNGTLLTALLSSLGYPVHRQVLVPDGPEPLRQALSQLASDGDVVVSTGGVSAGDTDWIRGLVGELGEVRFWKLFLKPGRPFAWGQVAGTPFFGLPGNPVAAAITALQLLWPALQRLEGAQIQTLPRLRVRLEAPLRRQAGRPELARAALVVAGDGALLARITGSQASSRIGSLESADLLLEIPAELGALQEGQELWAQLLRLPIL